MIVLKHNSKEKSDFDWLLSSYDLFITFIISVTAVGFSFITEEPTVESTCVYVSYDAVILLFR